MKERAKKKTETKVDRSKRVNEPRMKPSSAKYLPFFVLGEEGSLYIFTHHIREHTHARVSSRDPNESEVSRSLLGEIAFSEDTRGIPAFQELSRWPWSVTPVGEHLLPHPPLSPRDLSPYFDLSFPPSYLPSSSPPWSCHRPLVLLNHYKPSSTLNRKQALVHGQASTRKHLNPTIKSHLWSWAEWPGFSRSPGFNARAKIGREPYVLYESI